MFSFWNYVISCRLHTTITCSTVVLTVFIGDEPFLWSKPKFNLRNFVIPGPIITKLGTIDYVSDPYLYANFDWIWLGGEFPANTWLFLVSLFLVHTPGAKTRERICTIDGSKRVKSGNDVPFGGFVKKFSPHPQYSPNSENFALRKQFFVQNTYKSWRKRCQNSYSNRKQPMGFQIWG